jgi:SAM-dependent methyltransferase
MTVSYSNRFQKPDAVEFYDAQEYGAGSYSSRVWQWQRPVVEQVLRDFRRTRPGPVRLLDFACGTGRVLAALEPLADSAVGVDISENMAAVARTKCRSAQLLVGDILTQPALLPDHKFDVISCFRFLLNAEPELRLRVLRRLREALCEPDGLLLVNVHGNARSLRHPAIVWRRWRERPAATNSMLNEMTPGEARELLRAAGFQVVRQFGFGLMPPTFYRTPLRGVADAVDRSLAGENWWRNGAIDLLFVCRPGEIIPG